MLFIKSVAGFILLITIAACQDYKRTEIVYPSQLPDSIPVNFLPGTVTSNDLDFNSAYSPDGKSFFFGRSEKGRWVMYMTTFDGKDWSTPVHPAFHDSKYSEADPVFTHDGDLYFISNRPINENDTIDDYDIWMVEQGERGKWGSPANVSTVNSDSNEFYISFAGNGNLYFASAREGGYGEEDIYVSKYENEKYNKPSNLGGAINSKGSDHDPLISKDEQYLIFASSDRPEGRGQADLYFSQRFNGMHWSQSTNLGDRFNTTTYEYCPYLTPDGQYFFFSSENDVRWIKSDYLFRDIKKQTEK